MAREGERGIISIFDQPPNCIDRIRCPAIEGLSRESVHILHKSLVGLVYLRRSIDNTKLCVDRSWMPYVSPISYCIDCA